MKRIGLLLVLVFLAGCSGAVIGSPYGSRSGIKPGTWRAGPHSGVDYLESVGAPVIAAIDGEVVSISNESVAPRGCGIGVVLAHRKFDRFTIYCHLSEVHVQRGQWKERGETLGLVGMTGGAIVEGVSQVHFGVLTGYFPYGVGDGNLQWTEDPAKYIVGCFNPKNNYPGDRFALTHPLRCMD